MGSIAGAQKIRASLHVFAQVGTTLDVRLRSADNSGMTSPTTVFTFTQATGVTAEYKEDGNATSDDWWDIDFTIAGGSFTFAVIVGIR